MFLSFLFACQNDVGLVGEHTNYVYLEPVIDIYDQPEPIENLDILVVIDRSCSMADEANQTGEAMMAIASTIDVYAENFSIGFISADPNCNSFVGPFDQNQLIDIALAPSLLSSQCPYEEGFSSTYLFLEQENFLNPASDLIIIMVSDEDEQSAISASLMKQYLDSYKTTIVEYVGITSLTTTSCSVAIGSKYIELSSLYNRAAIEICSDSWEMGLAGSSILLGLISELHLSQLPAENSIKVFEDSNQINEWVYDPSGNMIKLTSPRYGSTYIVTYYKTAAESDESVAWDEVAAKSFREISRRWIYLGM